MTASLKKKRNTCLRIVKKCRLEELITPKQVTLPYQYCIRTALVLCLFISLHQSTILFIRSALSHRLPHLIDGTSGFYTLLADTIQKSHLSFIISTYFKLFIFGSSVSIQE